MANTIQIGADTSGFVSAVNRARTSMTGLGSAVQSATAPGMFSGLTSGLQGLLGGVGIMAALTGAARGLFSAMQEGGALVNLSMQTGVAVDRLMELQMAFDQAGMSAGDIQPVFAKLQKTIGEAGMGNKEAANKFKELGLSVQDMQGLSADQQFAAVGDAISKIENPTQRAAMAMKIFEDSGTKLLSVFSSGGLKNAQENLGDQAALMAENAGLFKRVSDVLGTAGSKLQGLFVGMASAVVPQIIEVVDSLNSIDLSGIGKAFGDAISFWINYFKNFGTEGAIIYNTLKLAFMQAVNSLNEALQMSWGEAYAGLKLAFADAINFLAVEMAVMFSKTAAKVKALFSRGNADAAGAAAEKEARARPLLIDREKLKKDLDMSKYKVVAPLFDTTETEGKIEQKKAQIEASRKEAEDKAKKKYTTPLPPPPATGFIPKMEESKPVGAIVSSMAKIGGDQGYSQTSAVDYARQQLVAQQQTAQNTAKMVDKLNKLQPASAITGSIYQ
jgi:hypothetical protein